MPALAVGSGSFVDVVDGVGQAMDGVGVAVIVGGILYASLVVVVRAARGRRAELSYRRYRHALGRAILLGLEILVAADIIRSVAVTPTFDSVGVLAIIVAIRTFLSFSLEVELTGRWPWQPRPDDSAHGSTA